MITVHPVATSSHYNIGSMSDIRVWYDMSRHTESGGADIDALLDWGPNGYDATQSTDTLKAHCQTMQLNGHRAAEFDNLDDKYFIDSAAFEGLTGITICVVMKKRVSGSKSDIIAHWDGGSGESNFAVLFDQEPKLKILSASHTFDDGAEARTTFGVVAVRADTGVNVKVWHDGVEPGYTLGPNLMDFPFDATFTNKPAIGTWYEGAAGRVLDGMIAELVVFGSALSDLELNWVHKAMARKWGLTVTEI